MFYVPFDWANAGSVEAFLATDYDLVVKCLAAQTLSLVVRRSFPVKRRKNMKFLIFSLPLPSEILRLQSQRFFFLK